MESFDFEKALKEMKEKAARYDNLSTKYHDIARKLEKVEEKFGEDMRHIQNRLSEIVKDTKVELEKITAEIDPIVTIKVRQASKVQYDVLAKEFYNMLIHGTEITTELIAKTYPNLEQGNVNYIFALLQDMSGVDKRKEGVKAFLFAKKEI